MRGGGGARSKKQEARSKKVVGGRGDCVRASVCVCDVGTLDSTRVIVAIDRKEERHILVDSITRYRSKRCCFRLFLFPVSPVDPVSRI